jgi:hypothetical protein
MSLEAEYKARPQTKLQTWDFTVQHAVWWGFITVPRIACPTLCPLYYVEHDMIIRLLHCREAHTVRLLFLCVVI